MNTATSIMRKLALLSLALPWTAGAAQTPNHYACEGKNASVVLTVGGGGEVGIMPEETRLQVRLGKEEFSFRDPEILSERSSIGQLWSATLEQAPDLYVRRVAVIIPEIALGAGSLPFQSQLILTTTQMPLVPDTYEGVIQTSKFLDLACSASLIYF